MTIISHSGQDQSVDSAATAGIEPLTPRWTPRIRLSLLSRFDSRSLADHVRRFPKLALVADAGRQYVVAGPWRKRSDIAELIEASPGALRSALIDELAVGL